METRTSLTTAALLRRCLIALAALSVAGLAGDLAMLRHWQSAVQLIPWFSLGLAAVAIALLLARPSRGTVWVVRTLSLAVALSAALGVFQHVLANYESGPLDFRYTDIWGTMSEPARWWAAMIMTVGPAPPLAAAALANAALLVLIATVRHPALGVTKGQPAGRLSPQVAGGVADDLTDGARTLGRLPAVRQKG
ncbi:MAG: hypothetical protein M3442_01040 [Chloroflexota bacterium]|nr:hypothetical protein [Chloroflexota bacterium]